MKLNKSLDRIKCSIKRQKHLQIELNKLQLPFFFPTTVGPLILLTKKKFPLKEKKNQF